MTTYSYAQLEELWTNAGGSSTTAPVAAAIALAESGGNSLAAYPGTTVQPGQGSTSDATGLWQILGLPSGNFTAAQLTDPQDNAAMAVAKYTQAGDSFSPWTTYTSGAYEQYLKSGVAPAPSSPSATAPSPDTPPPASSSTDTSQTGLIGFSEGLPFGIGSMFKGFQPVLHAIATVIDYSFSMFQPGQGQRLLFALGMIALAFLAYKILASAGAVPNIHPARVAETAALA